MSDRDSQKAKAERALAALVVADSAFKAAWGPVLAALNSVPVPRGQDENRDRMFEIEASLARVAEHLRGLA